VAALLAAGAAAEALRVRRAHGLRFAALAALLALASTLYGLELAGKRADARLRELERSRR
jgi:hypothetical protein